MLRESAITLEYSLDLSVIADPVLRTGIPGGTALLRLVDVVLGLSSEPLHDVHRDIIDQLGPESLVDAAAAFGNFEMMNRVAEGTGIPIPNQAIETGAEIVDALGLLKLLKS